MKTSEYATKYVTNRAELKDLKHSTVVTYKDLIRQYITPKIGNIELTELCFDDLEEVVRAMRGKKLSVRRINMVLMLLNAMLADAAKRKKIPDLLHYDLLKAKSKKEGAPKVDPFSEAEIQLILAASDEHYTGLFTVLANTGARPCEITSLRWQQVNFHSNSIKIMRARVFGEEGTTKTGEERSVPMLPPVRSFMDRNKKERGYIFLDKQGDPIDQHLNRIWQRACSAAGVRPRPLYQLRHSFAVNSLKRNVPLAVVSKLLGHASIRTTISHYVNNIQIDERDIAQLHKAYERAV